MFNRLKTLKPLLLTLAILGAVFLRAGDSRAAEPEQALLAGGCFWCVEADFEKVPGVLDAVSGFAGGTVADPSYKEVVQGGTGHIESVLVTFDPAVIDYRTILDTFLRSIDPLDDGGQFCDRGRSYIPAIFALNDTQSAIAEDALAAASEELGQTTRVKLLDGAPFYEAEEYHQDYYKSKALALTRFGPQTKASAYKKYRAACGRDDQVRQVWGDAAASFVGH